MNQHSGQITETLATNYFVSSRQKLFATPIQLADWLLRLAVVIHIAGFTISLFARSGSAIGGVALMQWGISDDVIFLTERVVSAGLLLASISLLVYPTGFVLALIGGAIAAEAYAITEFGGNPHHEYALVAHLLRFFLPLAVILLVSLRRILPDETKRIVATAWVLRIGLGAVFFMHGLEAYWHNPQFVDLIIGSGINVFGLRVDEGHALKALTVIGILDIGVAILLILRPSRTLLAWMCFWGLITALSRPFSMGIGAYTEVLVRVSHFVVPIVLWLLIIRGKALSVKPAFLKHAILLVIAVFVLLGFRPQQTEPWTLEQLMDPADLALVISNPKAKQPLIFSVGPAAVIRSSIDVGPAEDKINLNSLSKQLEDVPRDAEVVIYCGCCPFDRCPNIRPAFRLLNQMHFTNHKLLNISNNVKTDWIDRGYPVAE